MSGEQSEVEVLKEELNFLTGLLHEHKTRGAYYQRPHFNSVPYVHPNVYSKKSTKCPNLNSLNIYKPKYHVSRPGFNNHFDDRSSKISTSRSFVRKQEPVPVFPKQNVGYNTKQGALWQRSKIPSCTQNLSGSFKIVKTSTSAKVNNTNIKTLPITKSAKVVAGATSILAVDNASRSEINKNNGRDAEFSNFVKSTSVCAVSKKNFRPLEENHNVEKNPKIAKVSYVPCSDCIIEISEYENGELRINQKKLDSSVQENIENSALIDKPLVEIPQSSWSDAECEEHKAKELSERVNAGNRYTGELSHVYQKPVIGSGSYTVLPDSSKGTTVSNAVETDTKLSNISSSSKKKSVPSLHKFTKSQHPCERRAKYCKVNTNTSKSQNSVAKDILKNKYSVKKSDVMKCKINKELKRCPSQPLKYMCESKSASRKCLVNYPAKKSLLSIKNVNKRTVYTSYSCINSVGQNHIRSKVTKSAISPSSYAKTLKKANAVHMQNVYKIVNSPNSVASKGLKGGNTCKILCEKNPSSLTVRHCGDGSNKKWSKSNDSTSSVTHCSLNAVGRQRPDVAVKSESKKALPSSLPQKTLLSELKNKLRTTEMISQHNLHRNIPKKSVIKKPNLNPSPKSFSDSHTLVKKAKKVRLSKTTYKVVNRYADHVSQVVQMIKTKYKTVNKRSASNSHLKWLQEQKKAYSANKVQKSLHLRTKRGWAYHHSSVEHQTRKRLDLLSKTSRKHPLEQKKVLKNICGITYKVSKTQIKKSFTPKRMKKSHFALCNRKNSIIVNVRVNKFQMSPGRKSLKRLGTNKEGNKTPLKRVKIGGFTFVQEKNGSNCLVKSSSATQNVASRMLHRSINMVRAAEAKKTMQKSNVFCMFFNRFGRCNKEGNCPYIHDPSKIAVCTRFLRGTCRTSGCPFSHEISPGKMAVCSFFLQGNCTNSNCPYQHTNIKPGTKLCKAFVKGYCNRGSECQDAHILACPQFICEGFCDKESSCLWPHPRMKSNIKKRSDLPEDNKKTKGKDSTTDDISDQRYFTYEPDLVSDKCIKLTKSVEENTHINEKIPKVRNKKITFPKQPEFIPLLVSNEEL